MLTGSLRASDLQGMPLASTAALTVHSSSNISLLLKELQVQWHGKRNRHLDHILIKPYSRRKVV